jgi:serine/threonine protein kinase
MSLKSKNFVKEEFIGSGSYGDIYKGKNHYTGKEIAIKKIKFVSNSLGIPAEILREILILRGLCNDNIIELEDVVPEKENIFLIFQLMNCDLKHYIEIINPNPLSNHLIKHILRKTLLGLEYIHENNIIHRDMKPQNILINYTNQEEELEVRIADFGLSKLCSIFQKPKTKNLSKINKR